MSVIYPATCGDLSRADIGPEDNCKAGYVVGDPDFTDMTDAQRSVVDSTGKTWSLIGDAKVGTG